MAVNVISSLEGGGMVGMNDLIFIANEPVTDRLEFYNNDGERDPAGDFIFICEHKSESTSPSLENMDRESLKEVDNLILEIQGLVEKGG